GDLVPLDVLEDAVVSRGRPPLVVLGLQAVDRDDDREAEEAVPVLRNLADGARHELGVDAALRKLRQDHVELAVADERLAADDRDVERPLTVDQREELVNELLPLEVAHLTQRHAAAEMIVAVGVAARTPQRALACDLNGKSRCVPAEDASPRDKDSFHIRPLYQSLLGFLHTHS